MSASNKKKLRKQEAAEQMTKNQAAASKEAKKQKAYTLSFWVVIVLCVCIAISAFTINPIKNIAYRNTVAVEIGDYEVSSVELNYFFVDAVNQFYSQYQSYIAYLGFSTTTPLDEQTCAFDTTMTWADYFIEQAQYNVKSTYAVYDLAMEAGFVLEEADKTSLETNMTYMTMYAALYGFSNVDKYLINIYGNGSSEESYRAYLEKCAIAEGYYTAHSESLEFDAEALSAYDALHERDLNGYTYAYYYLPYTDFYAEGAGTKGDDGKMTYTDEEVAAAVEAAKAAAEALAAGTYPDLDSFDAAINALKLSMEKTEEESDDNTETQTTDDETTGDETTDGETTGDETTDGETTGDETTGDETTDGETTGDETTDDETTDDETTDGETTGDETTDDETTDDETTDDEEEEEEPKYKYESTKRENVLTEKLDSLFADWILGKTGVNEDGEAMYGRMPQEGAVKMFTRTTTSGDSEKTLGFYVVRNGSVSDNRTNLVNVRHILIMFKNAEGKTYSDGITSFTEAQKKTARLEIEKIKADFESGKKTELDFEELAKEKSEDTGSKENGGLYEEIYPGQMVTNFNDWCFDEARQSGDYEIVETEYGYHLIYFVSECELNYRDYMITESLRVETMNEWYNDLMEATTITEKTTKFINKEMTLG